VGGGVVVVVVSLGAAFFAFLAFLAFLECFFTFVESVVPVPELGATDSVDDDGVVAWSSAARAATAIDAAIKAARTILIVTFMLHSF
jgi:hypothetical protein